MIKKFILPLFCILSISSHSQVTMPELWKTMPDSIIPYLNLTVRNEMLDFNNMKIKDSSKNLLDGKSRINQIDDRFADIQLTDNINLQLRILQRTDSSQIICMVKTYGKEKMESTTSFYKADWNNIEERYGLQCMDTADIALQALTQKPDTMTEEKFISLRKLIEPVMVSATLGSGDAPTITYSLSSPIIKSEDKESINVIKTQKSFKWNGEIFK